MWFPKFVQLKLVARCVLAVYEAVRGKANTQRGGCAAIEQSGSLLVLKEYHLVDLGLGHHVVSKFKYFIARQDGHNIGTGAEAVGVDPVL